MTKNLPPNLLRLDAGTQSRIRINSDTVDDYATLLAEQEWPFPPLDVLYDGSEYFLADGFHRVLAALRGELELVPCRIHKGTATDARIFSMTANDKNGLRMTRADKRACVEWLLDNGGKMKQKEIASKAGVSVRTVKNIIAESNPESVAGKATPPKRGKGQIAPSTPIRGDSAPFAETGEPCEGEPDCGQDDFVEKPETPKRGNGKPPKQFDESHWLKQWDHAVGPLVRLIDNIAENFQATDLLIAVAHDRINDVTIAMHDVIKGETE